jgi:hypothetical protein
VTPVSWDEAALVELVTAARWYDFRIPGLGDRFISVVDEAVLRISGFPNAWNHLEPRIAETRRTLLKPFAWRLVYELREHSITVLALQHTRRKPRRNRTSVRQRRRRTSKS